MNPTQPLNWQPLELLAGRFRANVAALAGTNTALADRLNACAPARPYFIAARGDTIFLGRATDAGIEVIPDAIPAPAARSMAQKLFPENTVRGAIAIGGLAYGWLWDRLSKMPASVPTAPGHRPPVYLLTSDLEQLWAVLHVMEWVQMLSDRRFPIFCGPDAADQFRAALVNDPLLPRPAACVGADSALWAREDFATLMQSVTSDAQQRTARAAERLKQIYGSASDGLLAGNFRTKSLRILGITSLYTTFLQHSMRDWLAGFERLGHETKLLIEPADHLSMGALAFAEALAEYEPDLVVVIDHYRAELGNLPDAIPFVMWVQDLLPNIYNDLAGPAQGPRDFSMGFGRMPLTQVHGYPAERFMGCPIGINEERFKPIALSRQDLDRFGCDASYVSHASTPSDVLLKSALTQNPDPNAARLLWDLHDRLVGDFENGGVTHAEWQVKQKLEESIAQTGVQPSEDSLRQILLLFNTQINNAIFRHQALKWVADLGVHLKLYGNGWEKHPTLGRFACGPADTLRDVPKICAASKVNLQITPHGSVHQRLLEGLVAGGFYLIRWTPGDQLGIAFRLLRDWCLARGIASESALRSKGDEQVRRWISECDELRVDHSDQNEFRLYDRLIAGGEAELTTRAGAVWPEEYPQVSFRSGAELQLRLTRFLGDEQQRQQVAAAMRAQILENYTYASISKRLLRFIGDELRSAQSRVPVAA